MKRVPQIRLRTIFLLFFCAAVGLTVGTSPTIEDETYAFFGWHQAQLNWHYALGLGVERLRR